MHAHPTIQSVIEKVNNWGRWGPDDELGMLNYITLDKRARAARLVRRGATFSLSLPLDRFGLQPPMDRRLNPQHIMLTSGSDLLAGTQPGHKYEAFICAGPIPFSRAVGAPVNPLIVK